MKQPKEKEREKSAVTADYRCNVCGDVFSETFTDEVPHDYYPCTLCDDGEGKRIRTVNTDSKEVTI